MDSAQIEKYLHLLGKELQRRDLSIRLLMVGGAFMLTQGHKRADTDDIDIVVRGIAEPRFSPAYQEFKVVVQIIAMRHRLEKKWLNDVITDFMPLAEDAPEGILWKIFGTLEVYIPPHEFILALKLLAGREKDKLDIRLLAEKSGITTQEQARHLVDTYIPKTKNYSLDEVEENIAKAFPEPTEGEQI